MKRNIPSSRTVVSIILCILLGRLFGADAATTADIAQLVEASAKTRQRLLQTPARWTVRCSLSPNQAIVVTVFSDVNRRSKVFSLVQGSDSTTLCRIVEQDGFWFVDENGRRQKTRPFEATLHLTGAYYFNSLADLMCVVDGGILATATLHSRNETVATYRVPLSSQQRTMLEQAVDALDQLKQGDPQHFKPETERQMLMAKELLHDGTPLQIDETTGVIIETRIQNMTVRTDDFRWLDAVPPEVFRLANGNWDEATTGWTDPANWMTVAYDPIATRGNKNPSLDGFLLDATSGNLRRLPYNGAFSMPLCFLASRHEILISAVDPVAGIGMLTVDLRTGKNTPITLGEFSGGMVLAAALSPDGREVAFMQSFTGQGGLLDFQMRLLNLANGKITNVGKPGRLGGPFSWLPNGAGIILKRFVPTDSQTAIEDRVVCRMNRDGVLTDLFSGDSPLVLRKSRRILYEIKGEWYTCNLDGSGSTRFADGLIGYGFPAVSPDEEHIAFMHFDPALAPLVTIFELGKPNGRRATSAPGLMTTPIWR